MDLVTTRLFVHRCQEAEHKWLVQGVTAEPTRPRSDNGTFNYMLLKLHRSIREGKKALLGCKQGLFFL